MDKHALYTTEQVRRLDRSAIEQYGIAGYMLMQRAAQVAFNFLRQRWPDAKCLVILAGAGNNGGDGYLLGVLARQQGLEVQAIALSPAKSVTSDAEQARLAFLSVGGRIVQATATTRLPEADVYVDALFGTGLTRPVEGVAVVLIEQMNAFSTPVLAIDIPSGLSADTGEMLGTTIRADATVTFVAHKRGLHTNFALDYRGKLVLDSLGLPESVYQTEVPDSGLLNLDELSLLLKPRLRNVHKGNFGHILAIGGDCGMGGAIRLTGEASLRVGAGLVSIATHSANVVALNASRPELMVHGIDTPEQLSDLIQQSTVLAVGPGLGRKEWGKFLWQLALNNGKPVVLDADALNWLAQMPQAITTPAVLTPHPGEAARLLECTTHDIQQDRFAAARALATRYQAVVVLKGAGTLIASPVGEVSVCPWGNPGMASSGMGDVLTGVIAGLLTQGFSPWQAAQLGVALHAKAGDRAAKRGERGLIASDLFDPLHRLANGLCNDAE